MKTIRKHFTRRRFLATLGLAGFGGVSGVGYAGLVEPQWLQVGRYEVSLSGVTTRPPLKILHLSDLHASPVVSLKFISEAIQLGLKEKPDVICLTGDFITHQYDAFDEYQEVLKPLAASAPTFACLGNHDGGMWAAGRGGYGDTSRVRDLLAGSGVKLLHNATERVRLNDRDLTLVGLGGYLGKGYSAIDGLSGSCTRGGHNNRRVVT